MLLTLLCVLATCSSTTLDLPDISSSGDRANWSAAVIGYEAAPQVEPADGGVVTLGAAGTDIWDERDEFSYLYTELPGDGSLTVRLQEFAPAHEWSKAGVMLREGLEPEARNALLYVSGSHGALLQARLEAGAETVSTGRQEGVGAGVWLRLWRWGDEVIGDLSTDGSSWREVGRYELRLGGQAYVGLAVTSHEPEAIATAAFSDLRVLKGAAREPPAAGADQPAEQPAGSPDDVRAEASLPAGTGHWVCPGEPLSPRYEPTYYVSTSGDDSNDGRSEERAFRSLQRAANEAGAGDVVWVRGGVYSADVAFRGDGTAAQPIVFESYPGECAVLDGSGLERYQNVRFEQASFYVFRNFEVRNAAAQGIHLVDSDDIVVSHVRSHHNGLSGIQNVNGDRNRFSYFIVHDNSDGRSGNADGIGISSGKGNQIDHCAAFRNSDDGVDAWRSHGTVIEYCISFENGFQGGDGNGFKAGGGLEDGNALLRYNVAFGNKTQGFNYNSGHGVTFEHNTSYDNGFSGFIAAYATLRSNLSFGNSRHEWHDDGHNEESANSWNLGVDDLPFASTDRRSPDFLALAAGSGAIGRAATGGGGSGDLGALPYGETLSSFMGIDVSVLIEF